MDKEKTKNNFTELLKNYVVDTTGLLTFSTPIFAAIETFGSGMSVDTSLESRLKVTELSYLGMGLLYSKGRDLSKKIFKITDESIEKLKIAHDALYTSVFNIGVSVPIYLSSGANVEEALKGTFGAVLFSLVGGVINGYGVDTYRDFMGLKPSPRLPAKVRDLKPAMKKGLAAALIAVSIGLTALVYKAKNEYVEYKENKKVNEIEVNYNQHRTDNKLNSAYAVNF